MAKETTTSMELLIKKLLSKFSQNLRESLQSPLPLEKLRKLQCRSPLLQFLLNQQMLMMITDLPPPLSKQKLTAEPDKWQLQDLSLQDQCLLLNQDQSSLNLKESNKWELLPLLKILELQCKSSPKNSDNLFTNLQEKSQDILKKLVKMTFLARDGMLSRFYLLFLKLCMMCTPNLLMLLLRKKS